MFSKKTKLFFIIHTALGIAIIAAESYLTAIYSSKLPIALIIVTILCLFAYIIISIYSIYSSSKLNITSQNLEEAKLYNQTLTTLHDTTRGFKHDFNNILQGIGGYIETNNMNGLKKYYSQLIKDSKRLNNLSVLNPSLINSPAIYNLLVSKYQKADELGIQISFDIFMNLQEIEEHMRIYEFTRILGILLDNAIEAASECTEKIVHLGFKKDNLRNRFLMKIENTYFDKEIDIDRIFEKDFSTKPQTKNSGLGLWEVRQILKKSNNLNLYTTKNEKYFVQQLEIYY